MTLPAEHPKSECELCEIVEEGLDYILRAVLDHMQTRDHDEVAKHFLSMVCVWWARNSLVVTAGDPGQVIQCFANALGENGVRAKLAFAVLDEAEVESATRH